MTDRLWLTSLTLVALAAPASCVVAAEYLSVEAAGHVLYPEATDFEEQLLALGTAQRARVAALAGPQPRHGATRVFVARATGRVVGHLLVDEVLGRQDLITYAIGIDADGALRAPEILAYRESHGMEIRAAGWRRQFAGRSSLERLRFEADIKNISGATLSCEHVTQGVRWLVALWQTLLRPAA